MCTYRPLIGPKKMGIYMYATGSTRDEAPCSDQDLFVVERKAFKLAQHYTVISNRVALYTSTTRLEGTVAIS